MFLGEWLVEVAWNLAKDCTEDPVNNVISVSRGEVCIISLGSPSLHPDLIHWRKMIRTVLAARPDFANSKFKKFKHGSIDPITSEPYKLDLWFVDDAVSGEVDKSKGMLFCDTLILSETAKCTSPSVLCRPGFLFSQINLELHLL